MKYHVYEYTFTQDGIHSILSGGVLVDVVLHVVYIADLTVKVHAVLYNYANVVVIISLTQASIWSVN